MLWDLILHNPEEVPSSVRKAALCLRLEFGVHRTGSWEGCKAGKNKNKLEPTGRSWSAY